jgi:hypothetical protein
MARNSQSVKENSVLTIPVDRENGTFHWLLLVCVAAALVAAIQFFWTLPS